MKKIFFYELTESEFQRNLCREPDVLLCGDLYTLIDYYSDYAGVVLDFIPGGIYTFQLVNDEGDMERFFVVVDHVELCDYVDGEVIS